MRLLVFDLVLQELKDVALEGLSGMVRMDVKGRRRR